MSLFSTFRRSRRSATETISAPPTAVARNERIYAVGDIHGRADLLLMLHELIESDAETCAKGKNKRIIYLGDYVDRGLDSRGVIDILISRPLAGFDHVFLKGNHEDLLLACREDPEIWPQWMAVGGTATLLSYGVGANPEEDRPMWEEFFERMPPAHLEFLAGLQLSFCSGDYLFVHAGIRPQIPLEKQNPRDLMWIRGEFLRHEGSFGMVVVHGHSISLKPEFLTQRIGIDTGAYATNALSCVVLDGTSRRLLSTGPVELAVGR